MQSAAPSISTYILSYNAPAQLLAWFHATSRAARDILDQTDVIVINQSTRTDYERPYQRICSDFGAAHIVTENAGASGGRKKCADLFRSSGADLMYYFEDDHLFHDLRDSSRCRFGFPAYVSDLHGRCVDIVAHDELGYLKLSFHEMFADHSRNFPVNRPAAFEKLGFRSDIGYFVGEAYFSNWPMLITQKASEMMFGPSFEVTHEGAFMSRAQSLLEHRLLRCGVLAAWPISHSRYCEYGTKLDHVDDDVYANHTYRPLT